MIFLHRRETVFATFAVEVRSIKWRENLVVSDIVPNESTCWVNGEKAEELQPLRDGDHVTYAPTPTDPATFTLIIASFLLNKILAAFLPRVSQKKGGDEESPTYSFSGLHNSRIEGLPIQACYGRMRVPGQIISEFTQSRFSPSVTDYFVQISFGEGPIQAIGDQTVATNPSFPLKTSDPVVPMLTGCQVNGNDLGNFSGVEAHVRLGELTQESVPGFEITRQQASVSFALLQQTTTGASNSALALSTTTYKVPATSDPIWATYGRQFSFTAETFDGVTVVVQFDQGLYTVSGSNIAPSQFDLLMRYIELDAGGIPITTGGPNGDGYVRVFPFERRTLANRSPFTLEYTHFFIDPQTYGYDTQGKALDADNSSSDYAKTTGTLSIPGAWIPAGTFIQEFSCEGWIQYSVIGSTAFGWSNGTSLGTMTQGWLLGLQTKLFGVSGTIPRFVPVFTIGAASGAVEYWENKSTPWAPPGHQLAPGEWMHVAVVYKSSGIATGTFTVFLNGQQAFSVAGVPGVKSPAATDPFSVGFSAAQGVKFQGLADEVNWYSRALTIQEIVVKYGGGIGSHNTVTTSLVAGYHFETAGSCVDYSGNGNTMTLQGSATSGVTDGIVFQPSATNTRKKSRYRVEIMRNNFDSTNVNTIDDATWIESIGLIDQKFSYPGTPTLSLKIPASEQLNTTAPTVTQLIDARLVPIWDGVSTINPSAPRAWSDNPAWCALDLIVDPITGLGQHYAIEDVDLVSLKSWADYCDEYVYDARGVIPVTTGWTDMGFTTGVQSFITIIFMYATYSVLRPRLAVGDLLGWTGVPIIGGVDTNLGGANISATSGLVIRSFIDFGNSITVVWNEALYGAPWATGTLLSAHATVAGTITGREKRFLLDANYDDDAGAWERLLELCATGRATPIRDGGRIRFKHEAPRVPVDIVTQTSIVEGTFEVEYGGLKDRPNAYIAEFHDRNSNYERSPASLEHPSVQNTASLESIRRESLFLRGITRRSQVMRQLAYQLNLNELLKKRGSFAQAADALAYEAGDVIHLSHDLTNWGKAGRVLLANTDTALKLDRDLVIGAGTYLLRIRNQFDGTYETRTVSSGAGSYAAGAAISVTVAFSWVPTKYDVFLLYQTAVLAQIVGISLQRDLRRDVQWIEYNEDVYDDQWFDDLPVDAPLTQAPLTALTLPGDVVNLTVQEIPRETQGGSRSSSVSLSWQHDADTLPFIRESLIWWKPLAGGEWRELARASGSATYAEASLPAAAFAEVVLFAVQPVTTFGARRLPEECASVALYPLLVPPVPDAPTDFRAEIVGDQVIYSWTPPSLDEGLTYECRRGGWILGQVVFAGVRDSSFGPTYNWASGPTDLAGLEDPTLYLRAVSPSGQMSAASTFVLQPDDVPSVADVTGFAQLGNTAFENQSWEDWGGAGLWHSGGAPDTTLSGLQVTAGYLEFAPGFLQGDFITVVPVASPTGTDAIPRRCFVEAFAVAEQVWPVTPGDMQAPIGSPLLARFTPEGPLYVTPDETPNCTLSIGWQYADTPDGVYLARRAFAPGIYRLVVAKFRITVTRPNEDYNVRIFRFSTRVRRAQKQNEERTPVATMVRARALRM